MFNSPRTYSHRVRQQKSNREKQKVNYQHIMNDDSDPDSDLNLNSTIDQQHNDSGYDLIDNDVPMTIGDETDKAIDQNYIPDQFDDKDGSIINEVKSDYSELLYEQATITINEAVK